MGHGPSSVVLRSTVRETVVLVRGVMGSVGRLFHSFVVSGETVVSHYETTRLAPCRNRQNDKGPLWPTVLPFTRRRIQYSQSVTIHCFTSVPEALLIHEIVGTPPMFSFRGKENTFPFLSPLRSWLDSTRRRRKSRRSISVELNLRSKSGSAENE